VLFTWGLCEEIRVEVEEQQQAENACCSSRVVRLRVNFSFRMLRLFSSVTAADPVSSYGCASKGVSPPFRKPLASYGYMVF
jgi:hypothetical protein